MEGSQRQEAFRGIQFGLTPGLVQTGVGPDLHSQFENRPTWGTNASKRGLPAALLRWTPAGLEATERPPKTPFKASWGVNRP